ncbi:MAG: putative CopG family antitoxin [Patescibacteria group bacterium]|jgi:predicted CopG family antitoxin
MQKTTIQINQSTLEKLKLLKIMSAQSYDDVLNNLLEGHQEDILSSREISEIEAGLENVKKGNVISIEDLAKDMGISLE